MLILPRNIQVACLLGRGMPTIFLHLGIFQPAKWGIFNRRKLGNIQPALTPPKLRFRRLQKFSSPLVWTSPST